MTPIDNILAPYLSKPLVGPEQTAQRAELRAVVAALAIENRPLHIRSDSSYVVNGVNNLLNGTSLAVYGDNLDLWCKVQDLLALRFSSLRISWVKGHANETDIFNGVSTPSDTGQ